MFVDMINDVILLPSAILLMRLWLGFTLFVQAYDKIFNIGIPEVSRVVELKVTNRQIPNSLSIFFVAMSSWIEFVCGILLVFGFMKIAAFMLIGVNMLMVSAAFSLNAPMWDMRHFFPRFLILIILMCVSFNNDWFSIDWLIQTK